VNDARSLAELQRWFVHVITHERSVAEAVADAESAGLHPPGATLPSAQLSAEARLAIYHSGYRARLCECLVDDYPALQHALGRAAFQRLCLAYIERYPSRSPSLNAFGRHMASFCRDELASAPYAAELARLEWAIVEVIHAPTREPLSAQHFARLTPERFGRVALTPSPALRLLALEYPANAFYTAFRRNEAQPELSRAAPSHTLVQRRGMHVQREDLDAPRARLLERLLSGTPVAVALGAAVAADSGMSAEHVNAAFASFFEAGLFIGLEER